MYLYFKDKMNNYQVQTMIKFINKIKIQNINRNIIINTLELITTKN